MSILDKIGIPGTVVDITKGEIPNLPPKFLLSKPTSISSDSGEGGDYIFSAPTPLGLIDSVDNPDRLTLLKGFINGLIGGAIVTVGKTIQYPGSLGEEMAKLNIPSSPTPSQGIVPTREFTGDLTSGLITQPWLPLRDLNLDALKKVSSAGKFVRSVGESIIGQPRTPAEYWATTIGSGISTLFTLAGANFIAPWLPVAMFSLSSGQDMLEDALAKGADPKTALRASIINAATTAGISHVGINFFLKGAKAFPLRTLARSLSAAASMMGFQEAENIVAKLTYDQQRTLHEGLLEAGIIGFISSLPLSAIVTLSERKGAINILEEAGLDKDSARRLASQLIYDIENGLVDKSIEQLKNLPPRMRRLMELNSLLGEPGSLLQVNPAFFKSMAEEIHTEAKKLVSVPFEQKNRLVRNFIEDVKKLNPTNDQSLLTAISKVISERYPVLNQKSVDAYADRIFSAIKSGKKESLLNSVWGAHQSAYIEPLAQRWGKLFELQSPNDQNFVVQAYKNIFTSALTYYGTLEKGGKPSSELTEMVKSADKGLAEHFNSYLSSSRGVEKILVSALDDEIAMRKMGIKGWLGEKMSKEPLTKSMLRPDVYVRVYLGPEMYRVLFPDILSAQQLASELRKARDQKIDALIKKYRPRITDTKYEGVPQEMLLYAWAIRNDAEHVKVFNKVKGGLRETFTDYNYPKLLELASKYLTPNEKAYADGLADIARSYTSGVDKTKTLLTGEGIGNIEGWVHMMPIGYQLVSAEDFLSNPFGGKRPPKTVAIARPRPEGIIDRPLDMDLIKNVFVTTEQAIKYIAYARVADFQYRVLHNPEIAKRITTLVGDATYRELAENRLNDLVGRHPLPTDVDNFISKVKSNISKSTIVGNITTALLQMTSQPYAIIRLGPEAIPSLVKNTLKLMFAPRNTLKFVFDNSPWFQQRFAGGKTQVELAEHFDRAILKELKGDRLEKALWKTVQIFDLGGSVPKWLTAYEKAYERFKGLGYSKEAAHKKAVFVADDLVKGVDNWFERVDAPQLAKQYPIFYQFLNQPSQVFNEIFKGVGLAVRGERSWFGTAMAISSAIALATLFEGFARNGGLPKDIKTYLYNCAMNTIGPVGGWINSDGRIPVLSLAGDISSLIGDVYTGDVSSNTGWKVASLLTKIGGIYGGTQALRTIKGLYDILDASDPDWRRVIWSKTQLRQEPFLRRFLNNY